MTEAIETEEQQQQQQVFKIQDLNRYFVKSDSGEDTYYQVTLIATCNCKDYKFHRHLCKHIEKVVVEVRKK